MTQIVPVRQNPSSLPLRAYRAWEYLSATLQQAKSLLGASGAVMAAGRLADPQGDARGRFPQRNVGLVAERVELKLRALQNQGVRTLVVSGANGADLITATVAIALGLQVILVVPGDLEGFFQVSVAGRPGSLKGMTWAELYAHVISRATAVVELGGEINDAAFAAATGSMMDILNSAQGPKFQVSITEGAVNSGVDHTADAARQAASAGITGLHISTQA